VGRKGSGELVRGDRLDEVNREASSGVVGWNGSAEGK